MLSRLRIGLRQWPQREPGLTRLRPSGRRAMQTFRKLPITQPRTNRVASTKPTQKERRAISTMLQVAASGQVEMGVLLAQPAFFLQALQAFLGGGGTGACFHGNHLRRSGI